MTSEIDLTRPFHTRIRVESEDAAAEVGIVTVDAKSEGPPLHVHRGQDERWTVLTGRLSVRRSESIHHLDAGATFEVPRATAHTYWNEGETPCTFRYELTPGHRFTSMMRTFAGLAESGSLRGTRDLVSLMHMAQVFVDFDDHVHAVAPPQWVMRVIAGVGRSLGVVKRHAPR